MKRGTVGKTKAVAFFLATGLALQACGSSSVHAPTTAPSGHSSQSSQSSEKVTIKNFAFIPANLTVKANSVILVTNDDSVIHTFTADNNSFNSGNILPGQTVAVQIGAQSSSVRIGYYCTIHQYMTGSITVTG